MPAARVNFGNGGLPGDVAVPGENGVTSYECEDLSVDGKKFEFTLNTGSPTNKAFAEKMCSCLRASDTQSKAVEAFNQVSLNGIDSWGAKGALAMIGAGIKRCERVVG
jgi:hypothetical protein